MAAVLPTLTAATLGSVPAATVSVDEAAFIARFDPRFASATHDIQDFIGYNIAPWTFDWGDPRLARLVGALSPMTVRCGGTWEDGIYWSPGPRTGAPPILKPGMESHTLTAGSWDPFASLMTNLSGIDLVVGLGALWRDWGRCAGVRSTGVCPGAVPWDSANAAAFIKHNRAAGFRVWGYELGNEPGVWNWTWGTPIVTPAQHAADYATLRAMLAVEHPDDPPKVVGPDTTWGAVGDERPSGGRFPIPGAGGPNYDYWNATLQRDPDLDVAAFHYYSVQPGLVQSWRTFVRVAQNRSMCTAVVAHRRDFESSPVSAKASLWLSEGGASYGGFGPDTKGNNWLRMFGGALSYLEDLSCAASNGAQVFARQQLSNFITGRSASQDSPLRWHYTPQPAWWVAVLWKKLIGTVALQTTVAAAVAVGGDAELIHAYGFRGRGTPKPAVVVVLVNWDTETTGDRVVEVHGCSKERASIYRLTSVASSGVEAGGDDNRQLRRAGLPAGVYGAGIALNGRELKVSDAGSIPSGMLAPEAAPCSADGFVRVQLPRLTAAFAVLG